MSSKKRSIWGRYKNTMLLIISITLLVLFADSAIVHTVIREIEAFGYFGAFVTGMLWVSTFTVVPATLILLHLSQDFNPYAIALVASAGAMLGDLLLFRFLKDGVFEELRSLLPRGAGKRVRTLSHKRPWSWLMFLFGALLIALPFPDEAGIALMGIAHVRTWHFALLSFALNTAGLLAIMFVAGHLV